jgi:hypothetical protein
MSEQAESAVGMPSRAGWQVPWTLIVAALDRVAL